MAKTIPQLDPSRPYSIDELREVDRTYQIRIWLTKAYLEGFLADFNENHPSFLPNVAADKAECRGNLKEEALLEYVEQTYKECGIELEAAPAKKAKAKAKEAEEDSAEEEEEEEEVEQPVATAGKQTKKAVAKPKAGKPAPEEAKAVYTRNDAAVDPEVLRAIVEESLARVSTTMEQGFQTVYEGQEILMRDARHGFNTLGEGQARLDAKVSVLGNALGVTAEDMDAVVDQSLEDYVPIFSDEEEGEGSPS